MPNAVIVVVPVMFTTWAVAVPRSVVAAEARGVSVPNVPTVEPVNEPMEASCQFPL